MEMDLSQAYATIGTDLAGAFSLVLVGVVGLVLVVWDVYRNNDPAIPWVAAAALAVAMVWEFGHLTAEPSMVFYDQLRVGGFASFINIVILGSGLLSVILAIPYFQKLNRPHGESYALVLFGTVGMIALATSNSLIMIFVGLETMSVVLYIMTGMVRENEGAIEAALKYFLLGAFATGFLLYGIALLYGSTGTVYLTEAAAGLAASESYMLFWAGVGLLLVGFLFKVGAVPFHMWTPDVYQGAPTPLTAFMSTATKAAAFGALVLVLYQSVGQVAGVDWGLILALVAVATMVVGNILAIVQTNVKRILAYSSIAHAGYVLVGLTAGTPAAYSGVMFYLLVYSVMNIGAFGVMSILEWDSSQGREQTLDSLAGIGFRYPLLGVAMGVFMFSLIGFPPLGGFVGKVAVFAPAIDAGYLWLAIIGVLTSAASASYYLRILYVFWMKKPEETPEAAPVKSLEFPVTLSSGAVIVICTVLLIVLGVTPGILEVTSAYFPALEVIAGLP